MIILGIDPGTAKMGYSVIKFNGRKGDTLKLDLLETDVIITPPDKEMHKRLEMLYKELNAISKRHVPDVMVIEKLFFNTNAKTAINVGQARGVSMLVAAKQKMQVFEYTALEAKMMVTGYGRSDKKQMQEGVKTMLKLDTLIKSDDANDAVAIILCHLKKSAV